MRELVDTMFELGLSISYNRPLSISTSLANTVCRSYEEQNLVCPLQLHMGVYTVAAVDNIDHNPSSSTAQGSFYGTGISLFQNFSVESDNENRLPNYHQSNDTKLIAVPESYTNVRWYIGI